MPYYIYKIVPQPIRRLEKLAQFDAFKEASAEAKRLRQEAGVADGSQVKVMFAENELLAEDMLNQPTEPRPVLGDD